MTDRQNRISPARRRAVNIGIAAAMGVLSVAGALAALFFGQGETDYFKMAVAYIGMLFAAILFVCCCSIRDDTPQRHTFTAVSVLLFISICLSGVLDALDGTAGAGRLILAIQTFINLVSAATNCLFWVYQRISLPKNRAQRFFTAWIGGVLGLYLVLLAINPMTGILFFVDASGHLIYSGELTEAVLFTALYLSYLVYILPQKCPIKKKISIACFAFFPLFYVILMAIWRVFGAVYSTSCLFFIFLLLAAYVVFFGDAVESHDLLLRQKAELAERSREQTELQTALMLSQIRPHFLYNAITAIRNLCKTDPAEAYTSLGLFADYLRGNMDALGNGRLIPFSKELEHIKTYLMLEQMRFGDELEVEYDIRYQDFSLPALAVQPIVENAVRHGATMNENGGRITVTSVKTGEGAAITVTDNGPGFDVGIPPSDGKSHFGLANVRNCLAASGLGELKIDSTPGVGTTVTILIREDIE